MQSSTRSWILGLILVVALVGLADASYLTLEHYRGEVPPCSLTEGCETVTTSKYSEILGVPVALLGALFYLAVLFSVFFIVTEKKFNLVCWLAYLSWVGLLAAVYFTAIQAFVLRAYCQYCLVSAGSSTVIFILAQYLSKKLKNNNADIQPET